MQDLTLGLSWLEMVTKLLKLVTYLSVHFLRKLESFLEDQRLFRFSSYKNIFDLFQILEIAEQQLNLPNDVRS